MADYSKGDNQSHAVLDRNEKGVRDYLAEDRNVMANDRTFLANTRTALACLAAGLTLIRFFESQWVRVIGYALIPAGGVIFALGLWHYLRTRKSASSFE